MKVLTFTCIVRFASWAVGQLEIPGLAQSRQVTSEKPAHYSVVTLGTLGGGMSDSNNINRELQVIGDAKLPGDALTHAVLWSDGRKIDLGTLGGPNSIGWGITESGDVSVQAETSVPDPFKEDFCGYGDGLTCRMFVWHDGRKFVLPTLGGNNSASEEMNNRGQVAGYTETGKSDPRCVAPQVLSIQAVVWEKDGQVRRLPPLAGDAFAGAFGINDRGDVAGLSGVVCAQSLAAAAHAVLWRDGRAINLGSLGGKMGNFPEAINNRGQVVGFADLPGDQTNHAFLWQGGVMSDLGTLPGDSSSAAFRINDEGQVTGTSCDSSGNCRAFLWQGGVMADLNSLIPAHSGLQLLYANVGSGKGQEITGDAYVQSTGETRAYVAIPTERGRGAPGLSWAARGEDASRKLMLPVRIRKLLADRLGFRRFDRRFMSRT
jgi:probable HAF family extracellular repeat protein